MHKSQVRYRFVPPNRRHGSLVPITKALRLTRFYHRKYVACGMAPLLHRYWRYSWQRLSALLRKLRKIANHLNFWVPGNRKVIVDYDATRPVNGCAESFANEGGSIPSSPNLHAAWDKLIANLHAAFSEIRSPRACVHFHPKIR